MKFIRLIYFLLLISLAAGSASCQQGKNTNAVASTVSAPEFKKVVDQKEGILLDVRTPEEFAEGHLPEAINIDYNAPGFKEELNKLDKTKTYEVYCRSGKRSGNATNLMVSEGFNKVINLDGGILAWQENGYEVQK